MATAQISTAAFVEVLGSCGLLEPPQLRQLTGKTALACDPHRLASQLVQKGWLTPYQVNRVMAGRGSELILGHYLLLERLGEGGMAQVFKARHRLINRVVALKLVHPDHVQNPQALARFRREVRSVAQLNHPNIVAALDADELNGTCFFVMEFVDGVDLGRLVKRSGPLPVDQVCDYIRQAACGLAHAHEKGLVHRDIKPSNLIVTTRSEAGAPAHLWGLVKVLDMGLARSRLPANTEESATVTQAGLVIGTPDFLAPEQAADAQTADIRADIYSMGATAYYLLSGQVPFPGGSTIDKLVRQRFEEPASLRELRPDVPEEVVAFVQRMLAKHPKDRPQTPHEIASDFGMACPAGSFTAAIGSSRPRETGAAIEETPLPPTATIISRLRIDRRRWPMTLAVAAACLVAGLALFVWLLGRSPAPANRPMTSDDLLQPFIEQAARPDANVGQLRSELIAFRALHAGTSLGRRATELLQQLPSAFDGLTASAVPREQGFALKPAELVAVLGDGRLRHWNRATAVTWGPHGKTVISGGEDRQLYVWDAVSGQRRQVLTGHAATISGLAVSKDGKRIISASHDGTVRFWDQASGRETHALRHPSRVMGIALSPDEKQLAAVTQGQHGAHGGAVHLWDVAHKKSTAVLNGHHGQVFAVAFRPDGRLVASGGEDGTIRLWEGGKEIAVLHGHQGAILALAFVGDGATLASGGLDKTLRLWDVGGRKERHGPRPHPHPVSAVAVVPGGSLVAAGCHDGVIKWWDAASGQERGTWTGHQGAIGALAVAGDARYLVSAGHDRSVRLWDIAGQREVTPSDPEPILAFALSADDQLLATGHQGGKVRLRNPATRHEQAVLEGHGHGVSALAFSSDRLLATGGWDHQVTVWDPATRKPHLRWKAHDGLISAVEFDPKGRRLVTASHDKTARLWDALTSRALETLNGHREGVCAVVFSPDGGTVATGSFDREIRLWDARTGKGRAVLHNFHGESLIFTPNGKAVIGGSEHWTVRVWTGLSQVSTDSRSLPEVRVSWHRSSAVSLDGTLLGLGSSDGQVVIWNLASNREHCRLQFPGMVQGLAFSSDGRHLLSANGNGTVAVARLAPPSAAARKPKTNRSVSFRGK